MVVLLEVPQPLLRLGNRRAMPGWDPPQRREHALEAMKPALPLVDDHFGDLDNAIACAVRSLLLTPEGSSREAAQHVLERLRALRGKPLKLHPPTL
jgi:hypothetical protein